MMGVSVTNDEAPVGETDELFQQLHKEDCGIF